MCRHVPDRKIRVCDLAPGDYRLTAFSGDLNAPDSFGTTLVSITERWLGSALWVAEGNFRKVKGYRDLPKLIAALENLPPRPPAAQARAA